MTPLPPPLGPGGLVFWRLDQKRHSANWASGEGSFRVGGRWNRRGRRVIYAALDPAVAILEVAVHTTFRALDTEPHVLTRARIVGPERLAVVHHGDVPNPNWLRPGMPSAGQQEFGDALLDAYPSFLIPSVVSTQSWNMVVDAAQGAGFFDEVRQDAFALDPRLHPPSG